MATLPRTLLSLQEHQEVIHAALSSPWNSHLCLDGYHPKHATSFKYLWMVIESKVQQITNHLKNTHPEEHFLYQATILFVIINMSLMAQGYKH